MFKISFLFIILFSPAVFANSFVMGHNLAITTDVPEKGAATIGTYMAGYSPSNNCLLATSTWMAWGYNSYSLIGRCRVGGETSWFDEQSLQLGYIQSSESLEFQDHIYRQKIGLLWYTIENKINEMYRVYTTINYMYFWDETYPFSLRREPGNDQPFQFTVTTLQQVRWTESMGFNFEFGILGLNYTKPFIHNGYSFFKTWEHWLVQIGLSITAQPNNFDRLYRDNTYTSPYDYSVHPEIQLQYFF